MAETVGNGSNVGVRSDQLGGVPVTNVVKANWICRKSFCDRSFRISGPCPGHRIRMPGVVFGIGEYRPWSTRSNLKRHSGLLNLPRRQRSERRGGEVNGAPRPCCLRSTLDHLVIGSGALSDDLETITVEVLPAQPAEPNPTGSLPPRVTRWGSNVVVGPERLAAGRRGCK